MLKILSTKSSDELVKLMGDGFSPVIDGSYLPDWPHNLYEAKKIHNCDVLIGFNSHEGAQFIWGRTRGKLIENKAQVNNVKKHFFLYLQRPLYLYNYETKRSTAVKL